jgi:hypothetical protein
MGIFDKALGAVTGGLVGGGIGGGVGSVIGGLGGLSRGVTGLFGVGSPETPQMPNYSGLAREQGLENRATAKYNAQLSNPWFSNPYGTQKIDWSGAQTGSTDIPFVNTELTPLGQEAWGSQQRLSAQMGSAAEDSLGRVNNAFAEPFDYSGIEGLQQGALDSYMARLNPTLDRREDRLRNDLANQGLAPGTEAYTNAMQDFNFARNDAESEAVTRAIGLQPQLLASALTMRNQPLNEFNALRTGAQVQAPQFQGFQGSQAQAAPVYQAGTAAGDFQTDLYNAQMGTRNAMLSGLFSLGGSALRGGIGR